MPYTYPKTSGVGRVDGGYAFSTTNFSLYDSFYKHIRSNLQTLMIFNTTKAATRRKIILAQQAGRPYWGEEFERHCFEGMRLEAHLLVLSLEGAADF